MAKLIRYIEHGEGAFLAPDTLMIGAKHAFNKVVTQNDDNVSPHHIDSIALNVPLTIKAYEIAKPLKPGDLVLSFQRIPLIRYISIKPDIDDVAVQAAYERLKALPEGRNEIWPSDHNVNEGYHIADPWGEPTAVLNALEAQLDVIRPPENHNKLASKPYDKFALDELHIDSFVGMERDDEGKKLKIWRTFLNLGDTDRTTLIGIHDPNYVDQLSQEELEHSYVSKLSKELDHELPAFVLSIPPRDKETGEVFGYEILTTNLLHGEYGHKDDYIAIINSLKPTERYGHVHRDWKP